MILTWILKDIGASSCLLFIAVNENIWHPSSWSHVYRCTSSWTCRTRHIASWKLNEASMTRPSFRQGGGGTVRPPPQILKKFLDVKEKILEPKITAADWLFSSKIVSISPCFARRHQLCYYARVAPHIFAFSLPKNHSLPNRCRRPPNPDRKWWLRFCWQQNQNESGDFIRTHVIWHHKLNESKMPFVPYIALFWVLIDF